MITQPKKNAAPNPDVMAFPPPFRATSLSGRGRHLSQKLQDDCIAEMVERIVARLAPRRVILFGSRANGRHSPKSDVDLLVEMDGHLSPEQMRRMQVASRLAVATSPLPKDIVVLGSDQVQEEAREWYYVAHQAVNEGIALYEREC